MSILRYEPWSLRVFNSAPTTAADSGAWLPPADVKEEATQFVLHLDIPGVAREAVEITAEQSILTIKGRRDQVKREPQDGYHRVERLSGNFQRRFSLPESADTQNIKAKVVNGVLEVSIPKLAEVQPHKILVEAA